MTARDFIHSLMAMWWGWGRLDWEWWIRAHWKVCAARTAVDARLAGVDEETARRLGF